MTTASELGCGWRGWIWILAAGEKGAKPKKDAPPKRHLRVFPPDTKGVEKPQVELKETLRSRWTLATTSHHVS